MVERTPSNPNLILDMAQIAEESGLDSLWVGDSLTAKPRLEPLATLGAVAASTKRVRLGTAVLLAALRHPVLLTQTINTLDLISNGRMVLAVGAGGSFTPEQKEEWLIAGVDAAQRGRRLEEVIQVVKLLSTDPTTSFHGQHFQLQDISVLPKSVQATGVPILFACHMRAKKNIQFQRVARWGDGYISISETPKEFYTAGKKIEEYAASYGRDLHKMERVFYMTVNINRDSVKARKEADAFLKLYYGLNIWQDTWGPWGNPEQLVQSIRQYSQAGATTIIIRLASFEPIKQLKLLLQEVIPSIHHNCC